MLYNYTYQKDASDTLLAVVAALKMQHWNYSLTEHVEWMRKKLRGDDVHLTLLGDDDTLIAYLNLVKLEVRRGSEIKPYLGIGNLCVDKRYAGEGFGTRLMDEASSYIESAGLGGVLLCKAPLVSFYAHCGWRAFDGDLYVEGKEYEHFAMFLSRVYDIERVELSRLF